MKQLLISALLLLGLLSSSFYVIHPGLMKSGSEDSGTLSRRDFSHVVLFYLKNPGNQAEREQFETSLNTFVKNSQHVKSAHLGTPAATDRAVIDKSYTYIMILTFSSKEEQDKYQDEAGHKQFIGESEHLWEKVVVYDSENRW